MKYSIYDNGGETCDRYTVFPLADSFKDYRQGYSVRECLGLSESPTDPQGFSQCCSGRRGPHLGKLIKFADLPENIQRHIVARVEA